MVSLKENIDTTTPTGQFVLCDICGLLPIWRRTTILQRQAEGIAIAKAKGKFTKDESL